MSRGKNEAGLLNLAGVFADAVHCLERHHRLLRTAELAACVHMLQRDVIRAYALMLDHYLDRLPDQPGEKDVSRWFIFNRKHAGQLTIAMADLIRFTIRLRMQTEQAARDQKRFGASMDICGDFNVIGEMLQRPEQRPGFEVLEEVVLIVHAYEPHPHHLEGDLWCIRRSDTVDMRDAARRGALIDAGHGEMAECMRLHTQLHAICAAHGGFASQWSASQPDA
jgi:hypothetical protein